MSEAYPQAPSSPVATLVIVNYRTAELVLECVHSALAAAGGRSLAVVVVDNASGDGSVPRLRAALPYATVLAETENRGFAAGVNAGMRATETGLVLLLNPDTESIGDSVSLLLAHLDERREVAVAAPLLEDEGGSLQASAYRRFPGPFTLFVELCIPIGYALVRAPRLHPYALSTAESLRGKRPAHVCGAVLAIRKQAYEQAGPLDEGFFLYLEETEWQRRVRAAGWEIELVPAARVRHLVRGGGEESLAPSPYFVSSAVRYLRLRGVPSAVARASVATALALSWLTLRLIALLPSKRRRALLQATAFRRLLVSALAGSDALPSGPTHG